MADREHRGLVARWLEGKERSEDYARSTLPTNRFSLFWDIMKGRFGRLMLVNLLVLVTCLPAIAILFWRYLVTMSAGLVGPFGSGLATGYPALPGAAILGYAEWTQWRNDIVFFSLLIPASAIAAVGISGGAYIIRNLIWTEGVFVANDFLRGIKRNYLNVLEALLIYTLVLFAVQISADFADAFIAADASYAGWMIASKVAGYIILAFFTFACMWMISLGINYKQGPWALVRNAVVMTVGTLPQTLFFAIVAVAPAALFLIGNNLTISLGIIIYVLIGFSYALLVWMDYSQWAFDRFVNPSIGVAVGRGLYNKETGKSLAATDKPAEDSAAMREYRRMIVAQGKSKLVSRPIKPIDDDMEIYQLPESFSRDDLKRLKESKDAIDEDVRQYEEAHKNDERYVEYNRQFEERERALEESSGKKKKPKRPKMLNKR